MKILAKLNNSVYLALRQNGPWNHRMIVYSNNALKVGKSYSKEDAVKFNRVISLREACSELLRIEHDERTHYEEIQKQDAIAVLAGELERSEYYEFYCFN